MVNNNKYYNCIVFNEHVYTKSPKCDRIHFINNSKWLHVDFSFGIWHGATCWPPLQAVPIILQEKDYIFPVALLKDVFSISFRSFDLRPGVRNVSCSYSPNIIAFFVNNPRIVASYQTVWKIWKLHRTNIKKYPLKCWIPGVNLFKNEHSVP